jgi:hypothetical protein
VKRIKRISRLLATAGVMAVAGGGALVGLNVTGATAAASTTTLSLSSTSTGVTCDDSNPTAPVCSNVAGGDVINVTGTGFASGAEASVVQCNDDPTQPQIFFLGNDIPVSCSALFIVTVGSKGTAKGVLTGTHTLTQGVVGPPEPNLTDTCSETTPSTTTITGCTATTETADAAAFPCPPTPAQQAAGDTCVLAIGDINGDRAIGTLLFTGESPPPSTTTTAAGGTTTTTSATPTTTSATPTTTSATPTTTSATPTTTSATPTTTSATPTTTSATPTTTSATPTTTSATPTTTSATPTTTSATPTTTEASSTTTAPSGTTTTTAPPTTITGAYELYCPGTPVGNIALNDAVTSATLSPAAPTAGQSFSVTGYQTVVNLPSSLASAAAAVSPGLPLAGSATAQIDASGATPATTPEGPLNFSVPLPSPIPDSGVSLSLPSTPATIPGFTATSTSGAITIQEDSSASLSLTVAGSALALTCTAYPNDDVPDSGITTVTPTGSPIAPVIAVAGGGSTSTTTPVTPTTKAPATTPSSGGGGGGGGATPVTAKSTSLAFTGVGPGIGILGILGGILILLGIALLVLVDAPRLAMAQFAAIGPATRRRMRAVDVTERLTSLNPMRLRRSHSEGVPDTSITASPEQPEAEQPQPEPAATWAPPQSRGAADRFSRVPAAGRELAQTTARHAVRTAQWLLGR